MTLRKHQVKTFSKPTKMTRGDEHQVKDKREPTESMPVSKTRMNTSARGKEEPIQKELERADKRAGSGSDSNMSPDDEAVPEQAPNQNNFETTAEPKVIISAKILSPNKKLEPLGKSNTVEPEGSHAATVDQKRSMPTMKFSYVKLSGYTGFGKIVLSNKGFAYYGEDKRIKILWRNIGKLQKNGENRPKALLKLFKLGGNKSFQFEFQHRSSLLEAIQEIRKGMKTSTSRDL